MIQSMGELPCEEKLNSIYLSWRISWGEKHGKKLWRRWIKMQKYFIRQMRACFRNRWECWIQLKPDISGGRRLQEVQAGLPRSLLVMRAAHTIQIPHLFLNISPLPLLENQTKSPDSSKLFVSEKRALPDSMNPCRDFTFAIAFMCEMLSYSDNIWQYKKPERE